MPSTILAGLHDIDWRALGHAYGDATDTPGHLERLLARSARTRRDALHALSHSVYHQSGGYSASPHALRFLLELLGTQGVRQKPGLFELVCDLGVVVGQHGFIATGLEDPLPWLERCYGQDGSLEPFLRCYELFQGAAPLFLRLLEQQSAPLRWWSAYALACIPTHHDTSVPQLMSCYERERHTKVRAAILLAIGLLSMAGSVDQRQHIRAWLIQRQPRRASCVLRGTHAIATLYVCDETPAPALVATLRETIVSEPDLYPFPWYGGDLSALALAVWVERGRANNWPVREPLQETWRGDLDRKEQSDELAPRVAVALVKSTFAPGRLAEAPLSADERAALEALLDRPQVFDLPSNEIKNVLASYKLPTTLPSLVRALGWLDEEQPERRTLAEQLPPRSTAKLLPGPLLDSPWIDLRHMLSRFYPFSAELLTEVADLVDWSRVSRNRSLKLSDDLLATFVDRWSFWHLIQNPATTWPAERIERFRDFIDWRALSHRDDLPWSEVLLERFDAHWDWDALSANRGLPWSDELIERYQERWCWHLLSQNSALPWSDALLRRYRRWYWVFLSGNDGLPWSESFLRTHADRLDWCQFCKVSRFPWSEAFLARHADQLSCWGNLSANPALPWSVELVARYQQRWNWDSLSRNPALPWSRELVLRFEQRWHWPCLVVNPAVPWDDPIVIERFAQHASTVSSYWFRDHEQQLPWSEQLIADPRLHHLFCADDHTLYSRFIAPIADDAFAARVLQHLLVLDADRACAQMETLSRHGRTLSIDHPLLAALNVSPPLVRLLALAAEHRPMLREAAARLSARLAQLS